MNTLFVSLDWNFVLCLSRFVCALFVGVFRFYENSRTDTKLSSLSLSTGSYFCVTKSEESSFVPPPARGKRKRGVSFFYPNFKV